jgi:L-aspartate oxidase
MIAVAALQRGESRGAHFRTDFPHSHAVPRRTTLDLHAALRAAQEMMLFTHGDAVS